MRTPAQLNRKTTALRRSLLAWFHRNARDLPWRRTRDPYRIWLSEIMLQQTRVETVIPYYRRFLDAFPTVQALAAVPEDRLLKLWEGLGYYSRARNLHKAAKTIAANLDGQFPDTVEGWQRLPGVGRYTAGAIASIAFGQRAPVLDGNVKRVLARLFAIESCIDDAATQEQLWSLAAMLVPPGSPGDFNQALMELGATVCTATGPDCPRCPVRRQCEACAADRQESLPVRKARRAVPHYDVVAAAIRRNGRYLLVKRPPEGLLGGLWVLPGGRIGPRETHRHALVRHLREKLAIDIEVGTLVAAIDHAYSHFKITLHVYRCRHLAGRPTTNAHVQARWVPRTEFNRYALPAANLKILDRL